MKKLIQYFYPKQEMSYFEKQKATFFILQAYFGFLILLIPLIKELISPGNNFIVSFFSKISVVFILIIVLFILKKKGIKIAGNIYSLVTVIILLIWMNIIAENITPIYKYIQGFYSVFSILIIGMLFASRRIIIINAILIFATTTRIFIFAKTHLPEDTDFFTTGYITHTVALIFVTTILYFANRFTEFAIEKANKETEIKEQQNQELASSEEEIRASNEELVSTTDALKESNDELIIAKEKAEESNRLKTEFLNNMSHEVRTPLNGILGFSNFLNDPNLTDATRKHYINIIQNSGNQLLHIIDDIMEISKLGTKQVKTIEEEICLNDLLLEQFSIFDITAKEQKIPLYLKKHLSDKESTIYTDKSNLNKILSNLLDNALKFTNDGFIEFGYRLMVRQAHQPTDNEPVELEIYVKDTGIGIKSENQKTIFERFSQEEKELSRNVGGLGLGLSIAKENAELLGGKITLQSEKENLPAGKAGGSTFTVTIPYKPVNSNTEARNSNNDNVEITKKQDKYTILIVEDEEVNCLYINTLLEYFELNLKTLNAKHGQEAVEMCKENSEIDFVFMDLKMPVMNGFEATKLIKEFRPDLPIVAQTAYSTREEEEQAFSAGCNDFISKPISEETLNKIISKYLTTS